MRAVLVAEVVIDAAAVGLAADEPYEPLGEDRRSVEDDDDDNKDEQETDRPAGCENHPKNSFDAILPLETTTPDDDSLKNNKDGDDDDDNPPSSVASSSSCPTTDDVLERALTTTTTRTCYTRDLRE